MRAGGQVTFERKSMGKSPPLIHRIYKIAFKIWRERRLKLFVEKIRPEKTNRLLDVGGYPGTWTSHPPLVGSIDSLNIHPISWDPSWAPKHCISALIGNGCCLEMPDGSYDIAFSNSVIEHVGSWENQVAFANEVRRVGRALWIQTPAHECPIEPHYLAPFMHWFPKSIQRRSIRYFTLWGWMSRPPQTVIDEVVEANRLLTKKEMKLLFPDCEIYTERLLGVFAKSYVAYRTM